MNKPPERIKVLMERQGGWDALSIEDEINRSLESWDKQFPLFAPHTEHFYVLEKEPMEKKTENLTTKEAWEAMARGECVRASDGVVHKILGNCVGWWQVSMGIWDSSSYDIGEAPYSIVPDPSKSVKVEDEYQRDKQKTINSEHGITYSSEREIIIVFIERTF